MFKVIALLSMFLGKSPKCGTKEVRRKGSEPEVPARVHKAAEVVSAVRSDTGARRSQSTARKKESPDTVSYSTKTFPGADFFRNPSNGQLCISRCRIWNNLMQIFT